MCVASCEEMTEIGFDLGVGFLTGLHGREVCKYSWEEGLSVKGRVRERSSFCENLRLDLQLVMNQVVVAYGLLDMGCTCRE